MNKDTFASTLKKEEWIPAFAGMTIRITVIKNRFFDTLRMLNLTNYVKYCHILKGV
jgi:hypothetical protein